MTQRLPLLLSVVLSLILGGCSHGQQPADPGSKPVTGGVQIQYQQYVDPRYGYSVRYPVDWVAAGAQNGDYLSLAETSTPNVGTPGIRVFVTVADSSKGTNSEPPSRNDLVGPGDWPYMSVDRADETQVSTSSGAVPGFMLNGRGTTRGVKYQASGLYVHGAHYSIMVVCSSAEEKWGKWESVCQEMLRSFVAGNLSTPQAQAPERPAAVAADLVQLRDGSPRATSKETFSLPASGVVMSWVTPTGSVLLSERNGTSTQTLRLVSTKSGVVSWNGEFEAPGATVAALGADGIAVYSKVSGLQGVSATGGLIFQGPSLGPGYVKAGQKGKQIYVVEADGGQPSSRYHVVEPVSGSITRTISLKSPFRALYPTQESDAVLLSCPDVRLMQGETQLWDHHTTSCAERAGLSDDGQLAFALLPGDGSALLQVLGESGKPLWERQVDTSKEDFLFAPGGKRFWFRRYDGAMQTPLVQVVDAEGKMIRQWAMSSKEDQLLAVSGDGTLAVVRVGDDVLALTDEGAVKIRIPVKPGTLVMLHATESIIYTIDDGTRTGSVYRFSTRH